MKVSFLTLILTLSTAVLVNGQSWSIGSAVLYGDDIQEVGGQIRGYYNFANDKVCFGPEYSKFLNHSVTKDGEEITKSLTELNFNIHYVFELSHTWGFYTLTGLNLSREKEKYESLGHLVEHKESKFGTNVGFGFHKIISQNVLLFSEYDHLFSSLSQNSFLFGLFYTFGKKQEHHE